MAQNIKEFGENTNSGAQTMSEVAFAAVREFRNPAAALAVLSSHAKKFVGKDAQRDAYGLGPMSSGGTEAENWEFESMAVALARQTLALCRTLGLPAEGAQLGAFNAFYDTLSPSAKIRALMDVSDMDANPSWYNLLLQKQEDLIVNEFKGKALGLPPISGPQLAPATMPSGYETQTAKLFSIMTSVVSRGAMRAQFSVRAPEQEHREMQKSMAKESLAGAASAIAQVRVLVAERSADTGLPWRQQGFTSMFSKNIDIQMSTMAMSLVRLAHQAEIVPEQDAQLKASMKSLCLLMTSSEAARTLSWLSGEGGGPDLGSSWKKFVQEVSQSMKWVAGEALPAGGYPKENAKEVLVAASALAVAAAPLAQDKVAVQSFKAVFQEPLSLSGKVAQENPEKIEPLDIDLSDSSAWFNPKTKPKSSFSESAVWLQAVENNRKQLDQVRQDRIYEKAVAFGKVCKGFVDNFSSAFIKTKVQNAAASLQSSATDARQKLKSLLTNGAENLDKAVEAANAWTDNAEKIAVEKVKAAKQAFSGTAQGAAHVAGVAVEQARQVFVGKVGELTSAAKSSVGLAALKTVDVLPEGFKSPAPEQLSPQKIAFLQVATLSGALFVGVTMAPVAGVAAATVGAVVAGMGLAKALKQASASFGDAARALPPALENFGARLGAKRQQAADAKVEPTFGAASPGMI